MVEVVRYTTVDDCGRAVNPMILHGQTHGGIAQGVGQALWESCAYDAETGQLLSSTLMDYALPRADMLPPFTTEISEVPSTVPSARLARRRGRRDDAGAGRRGQCDLSTPSPSWASSTSRCPATPERVWQAIQDAQRPR